MFRSIRIALVLLVCASTVVVYAQTGTGSLRGFVKDVDGYPIEAATVTVSSPSLIGELKALSGANGYFRVSNLPPGRYQIVVNRENYRTNEVQGITLRAGQAATIPVVLEVGEFKKKIVITYNAQIIDIASINRTLYIDGGFINRLPVSVDREWDMIWSTVPGVINEGDYGIYGARVEVHGASIFQNMWKMEGLDIGSTFTNANNTQFSTEIIEDVRIITSGFDAKISAGGGGFINVITKSGGNDLSGSSVLVIQPEDWNWDNVPGGVARQRTIYQPELSLGGPIMRDRAWFFANARYEFENEGIARTAEDLAVLDRLDLPRPTQDLETRESRLFAKLTYSFLDEHDISVFVNIDKGEVRNSDQREIGTDNTGITIESGGPMIAAIYDAAWTDSFSTSLSIGYRRADNNTEASGGLSPSITRYSDVRITGDIISGTGEYGYYNNRSSLAWMNDSKNERLELRADGVYYLDSFSGSHELEFGFHATPLSIADSDVKYGTPAGIYETKNDEGEWVPFYQIEYVPNTKPSWRYGAELYALYVQDTWRITDRLSVSAGLRLENQRDGAVLNLTGINPHIGFNYALDSKYSSSLRASYGIRQHYLAGRDGFSRISGGQPTIQRYYDLDLDGVWDTIRTSPGTPVSSVSANSIVYSDGSPATLDPELSMPIFHEFHLGYARVLPFKVKLDLSYTFRRDKNGFYDLNTNVIWDGDEFVGLRDPEIDNIYSITNNVWNWEDYQSFETSLTKEFSDGWQLIGSYTHQSKTLKGDWAPDDPLGHLHPQSWFEQDKLVNSDVFRVAAFFTLPLDFTMSTVVLWQTGNAQSPLFYESGINLEVPSDFELSNGRVITHPFYDVRQLYQPRNTPRNRLDDISNFNISIGRDFALADGRLQVQVQMFNVLNEDTFTGQSTYNSEVDELGQPTRDPRYTNPQGPRAAQIMLKYEF